MSGALVRRTQHQVDSASDRTLAGIVQQLPAADGASTTTTHQTLLNVSISPAPGSGAHRTIYANGGTLVGECMHCHRHVVRSSTLDVPGCVPKTFVVCDVRCAQPTLLHRECADALAWEYGRDGTAVTRQCSTCGNLVTAELCALKRSEVVARIANVPLWCCCVCVPRAWHASLWRLLYRMFVMALCGVALVLVTGYAYKLHYFYRMHDGSAHFGHSILAHRFVVRTNTSDAHQHSAFVVSEAELERERANAAAGRHSPLGRYGHYTPTQSVSHGLWPDMAHWAIGRIWADHVIVYYAAVLPTYYAIAVLNALTRRAYRWLVYRPRVRVGSSFSPDD